MVLEVPKENFKKVTIPTCCLRQSCFKPVQNFMGMMGWDGVDLLPFVWFGNDGIALLPYIRRKGHWR